MTPRLFGIAVLSLATLTAAPVVAQDIKPGLYQVTSKISGNSKMSDMLRQQQEAMAKMTPEQRRQMADLPRQLAGMMEAMSPEQKQKMKAMMGDQSGALDALQNMQMTHNADGSTSMKMCVTKDMVDQRNFAGQHGDCTTTTGKMRGGVMKVQYTCTRPPSKGEGEIRMTGPNTYSTKMKMVSTDPADKQSMEIDSTSTWVGADCGSVKPIDPKSFKQ